MKVILRCVMALTLCAVEAALAVDPAVNVLIDAIRERRTDNVTAMLVANPKLAGTPDALGASAVHYAAACGDKRILQAVLATRPDVDRKDRSGRTPLFYACDQTLLDNMTMLIANRAHVNVVDARGMTPLLIVCEKGKPQMAQALIAAGANIAAANPQGMNAILFAGVRGNEKLARLLIASGVNVQSVDLEGNTALHYAARGDHRALIKVFPMLMNVKNKAGHTPMNVAGMAGYTKFVQEMVKFGARAN